METLTSNEDIVDRWREHLEELLNQRYMHPLQKSEPETAGMSNSISQVEVTEVVGKLLGGKLNLRLRRMDFSYGTMHQIFTLMQIGDGAWEFASPVYMCFVGLHKAYDHIS
ncbi:hypothetical protein NFI96_030606 [Prochilodus magdalenae]|nr:hypothetical protein NFI96_030606 [Prochilodus magdalenae]